MDELLLLASITLILIGIIGLIYLMPRERSGVTKMVFSKVFRIGKYWFMFAINKEG